MGFPIVQREDDPSELTTVEQVDASTQALLTRGREVAQVKYVPDLTFFRDACSAVLGEKAGADAFTALSEIVGSQMADVDRKAKEWLAVQTRPFLVNVLRVQEIVAMDHRREVQSLTDQLTSATERLAELAPAAVGDASRGKVDGSEPPTKPQAGEQPGFRAAEGEPTGDRAESSEGQQPPSSAPAAAKKKRGNRGRRNRAKKARQREGAALPLREPAGDGPPVAAPLTPTPTPPEAPLSPAPQRESPIASCVVQRQSATERFGCTFVPTEDGCVLTDVTSGGLADQAGMGWYIGRVCSAVNGKHIHSGEDLLDAARGSKKVVYEFQPPSGSGPLVPDCSDGQSDAGADSVESLCDGDAAGVPLRAPPEEGAQRDQDPLAQPGLEMQAEPFTDQGCDRPQRQGVPAPQHAPKPQHGEPCYAADQTPQRDQLSVDLATCQSATRGGPGSGFGEESFGSALYAEVAAMCPTHAPKVTGMLLELGAVFVCGVLSDHELLTRSVQECLAVLSDAKRGSEGTAPQSGPARRHACSPDGVLFESSAAEGEALHPIGGAPSAGAVTACERCSAALPPADREGRGGLPGVLHWYSHLPGASARCEPQVSG